jgi:hypothetical protein
MVVLENGKLKINKPRFNVNVVLKSQNMPDEMREDLHIVKDKEFFTLRDIAEYLGLSYHIISAINEGKQGKKWTSDAALCPTITIEKI